MAAGPKWCTGEARLAPYSHRLNSPVYKSSIQVTCDQKRVASAGVGRQLHPNTLNKSLSEKPYKRHPYAAYTGA